MKRLLIVLLALITVSCEPYQCLTDMQCEQMEVTDGT